MGFRVVSERVGSCATAADLTQLILASSCTPPFTPPLRRGGELALDGSLICPAPRYADGRGDERTLVLLTRRYGAPLPAGGRVTFAYPSRPISISKWDYANPAGLRQAFDLGVADGRRFLSGRDQRAPGSFS